MGCNRPAWDWGCLELVLEPGPRGMGAPQATANSRKRCGGPNKPPREIWVSARGPLTSATMVKLEICSKLRPHRERWHLVSLCARKIILKYLGSSCSSENSKIDVQVAIFSRKSRFAQNDWYTYVHFQTVCRPGTLAPAIPLC